MQNWQLRVDDVSDPVPKAGQLLTKVLACGICGSDLHMLRHGAEMRRLTDELEADAPPDPLRPQSFVPEQPTIMGHEFCCEVIATGPDVERLEAGDIVVGLGPVGLACVAALGRLGIGPIVGADLSPRRRALGERAAQPGHWRAALLH